MFEVVKFANLYWHIIKDENRILTLRTVDSIGKHYWDSKFGRTWSECDLRSYLNGEFYKSLPEEDRKRIIPAELETNTRILDEWEKTKDFVWINSLEDVGTFIRNVRGWTMLLRNPDIDLPDCVWYAERGLPGGCMPYNEYCDVRPCIYIDKSWLMEQRGVDDLQKMIDTFTTLYTQGSIDDVDAELSDLMADTDFMITSPLQMFLFMWINSDHKDELARMFEMMTACPFEEFIKSWIEKGGKSK